MKGLILLTLLSAIVLGLVSAQSGCNRELTSAKNRCDGFACSADSQCNSGFCWF